MNQLADTARVCLIERGALVQAAAGEDDVGVDAQEAVIALGSGRRAGLAVGDLRATSAVVIHCDRQVRVGRTVQHAFRVIEIGEAQADQTLFLGAHVAVCAALLAGSALGEIPQWAGGVALAEVGHQRVLAGEARVVGGVAGCAGSRARQALAAGMVSEVLRRAGGCAGECGGVVVVDEGVGTVNAGGRGVLPRDATAAGILALHACLIGSVVVGGKECARGIAKGVVEEAGGAGGAVGGVLASGTGWVAG